MSFEKCCYFCPNNFKFCAVKKNYNYFLPCFKLEQLRYWQKTYRFNIFIFFLDTQNPFDGISESASRYRGTEKFLNCWLFFFTVLNST